MCLASYASAAELKWFESLESSGKILRNSSQNSSLWFKILNDLSELKFDYQISGHFDILLDFSMLSLDCDR